MSIQAFQGQAASVVAFAFGLHTLALTRRTARGDPPARRKGVSEAGVAVRYRTRTNHLRLHASANQTRGRRNIHKASEMIAPTMLLSGLSLVVHVAVVVPHYDVRSTCRAAIALVAGSEGRTVANCMAAEDDARKALEKDWTKTPAAERTQCTGTVNVGGSPSYVELLVCLEMMRDTREHEEAEHAKTRKSAGKS